MIRVVSWRSNSSVAFPWMWSAAFGWWSMVTMTIGSVVFQCVAALMMTLGLDRCSITPWIQLLHKTIRSSHLMLILIKIVSGINFWTMPATLCSTTSLATLLACRNARTKKWMSPEGDAKISWIRYIVYDFWESFPRSWGPTCCMLAGWFLGIHWCSWFWWNFAAFRSSLCLLCRGATRGALAAATRLWFCSAHDISQLFFKFHFCRYLCCIATFKVACALSWSSDYMNERNISWILFRQLDHFGHEPEVIFLLGHWNNEGLGCTKRMAVPEIHEALMQIPGCSGFGRHE